MGGTADAFVKEALSHNGYLETPVNHTKFGRWYGWDGVAWCHIFVSYVAAHSGCTALVPRTASCWYGWNWFKDRGQFFRRGAKTPRKGDIVYYGSSGSDHVGIVYAVKGGYIYTIEGNTSKSSGFNPNGGGVHKKKWPLNYSRIYGYGRPAYKKEAFEDMPDIYVSLGSTQKCDLKPGQWRNLGWDREWADGQKQHGNNGMYPSILVTPSRYIATVQVAIDGLGPDDAGWIRAAEAEKAKDGSFHYPEFSATETVVGRPDGKTVWKHLTWTDWLGKGRRLRIQAGSFTCPVVVHPYSVKIQAWKV